jgi:hypothetical protein
MVMGLATFWADPLAADTRIDMFGHLLGLPSWA